MLSRLSSVQHLRVNINSFSSVIEIGDSTFVNSFSRALAVQREEEFFYGSEGNYNYPVFKEPIRIPPLIENVRINRQNINPVINVSCIRVIGNAAASVIHIGSTCHIHLESRIKHIRQLRERENTQT
ncbi:spore germination protein GerPE [Neobacillus terrae]|jgi:spore germination protein PE|uniref:spore germination protein GerPE n=1 Tax=Neobacillus terrae TaxID=3034837 RepID=UPI00040D6265|nr:spore germination protein GerPE [Neobacillus terrae]NHM31710.1 spore germination protein GerPE [Neobacillus terrae]